MTPAGALTVSWSPAVKPEVIATRADSTEAPGSGSAIVNAGCSVTGACDGADALACSPPSTGASLTLVVVTVSEVCAVLEPSLTDTEKPVDTACPGATWLAVGVNTSACSAACSADAEPALSV